MDEENLGPVVATFEDQDVKLFIKRVGGPGDEMADEYDPWLKQFKAILKTGDGKDVGRISYRVVDTDMMRNTDLHEQLYLSEMGGSELEDLGKTLFMPNGAFRDKYVNETFGEEIGRRKFALFDGTDYPSGDIPDNTFIEPEYRRRGIGSWAIQKVLKHGSLKHIRVMLVFPGTLDEDYDSWSVNGRQESYLMAVNFFQKNGFRRIANSHIFCYAKISDHPSHSISIVDDDISDLVDPRVLGEQARQRFVDSW